MTDTILSPTVDELWHLIHKAEPKAEFGGSVGDTAHQNEVHTYHESYVDNPHDNGYSVHYWGDKHPARNVANMASAIDITLPPQLMIKYTARLHRWAASGKKTLSLVGVREFAGTLNGTEVYAMDTTSSKPYRTFGWDDSHLWHIHISINRRLVNNRRILSIADVFKD